MGSVTMAAMLASGCRSFGIPMALVRTLDISHSALIKHYNKRSLKWCYPRSSHNSALASESSRVYSNNSTTASSSSNGYPKYDRLLLCPSQNCPPRVEHLVVSEGGPVFEYICKALDFPPLSDDDYGGYHSDTESRHFSQVNDYDDPVNIHGIDHVYGPLEMHHYRDNTEAKSLSSLMPAQNLDVEGVDRIQASIKQTDENNHVDRWDTSHYIEESINSEPVDFENNGLLWLPPNPS